VISGVANVDQDKHATKWAITSNLPSLDLAQRRYDWISMHHTDGSIIQVLHLGLMLQSFRRDVIEKIICKQYPIYAKFEYGLGADINFSHACYDLQIPMYANTGNKMKHLRFKGEMLAGKRKPRVILQRLNDISVKKNKCRKNRNSGPPLNLARVRK